MGRSLPNTGVPAFLRAWGSLGGPVADEKKSSSLSVHGKMLQGGPRNDALQRQDSDPAIETLVTADMSAV